MFESYLKSPISFPTLTGSIVTFNSQYAGLPLKSHTVAVTATQSGTPSSDIVIRRCGKNLLPMTTEYIKSINTEGTWNNNVYTYGNVMYTVNSTNNIVTSIDTSGTSSSSYAFFYLVRNIQIKSGETYSISGSPVGKSATTYRIFIDSNIAFPAGNRLSDESPTTQTRTSFGDDNIDVFMQIYAGQNMNGKSFLPMLELGSDISSFEAYNGNTYKIIIGSTVNEGEYNARTGVLEVTQPTVQTLQLPPCPIDTLEGVNNIFADTGDTTLQYIKFG